MSNKMNRLWWIFGSLLLLSISLQSLGAFLESFWICAISGLSSMMVLMFAMKFSYKTGSEEKFLEVENE